MNGFLPKKGLSRAQVDEAIDAALVARDTAVVVDDFLTGSTTTGIIGSLGWAFTGGTVTLIAGEAGHPGLIRRATGTTINTYASLYLRNSVTTGPFLPVETFDMTWIVRLNTNDADTTVRVGMGNNIAASSAPNHGIYFEKVTAETSWYGVCRANSGEQRTAAIASTSANMVTLRARRIDASTIGFRINGGTEVTQTASIPTTSMDPGVQITNATAADKTIDVDFFSLAITGLSR
jgi:hypothetical protein